jgi:ATP adenylyltransferase
MAIKKHFNIANARVPEQLKQMEDLQKRKICPFCREHFEVNHREPILKESKYWLLTKNDYPYDGAKIHLLLVYKNHIDSLHKVSKDGMTELLEHVKWAKKKFKIPGASLVMRFGNNKYTGATITHLHAHLVSGYKQNKKSEAIRSTIGFKK